MLIMKKIFSIFILLGFIILNACDPVEDIYNEIDAEEIPAVADVEYTLTSDDYATILDAIIATNPSDSINGQFIAANEFFTDEISIQDYIPYFLNEEYPWLGPGSTAKITYNYNGDMPENLASYVEMDTYELETADYDGVDSLVKITQYFYPDFNPDLYLPGVLANAMPGAAEGDQYLVSYNYSDVSPVINIVNNTKVFEEDFETAVDDEVIAIDNWSQFTEAGTEQWEGREFGGNLYAQFSAYSSGEASNIGWLITSAIDLSEYSEVILNFKSKDGYNNGDPVKVYISDDYSGTGDPTTATWVDLAATFSTGNASGYASSWTESGDISLDSYTGGTVYIAFKYDGGDGDITTTIQIDDFAVTALTAGYEVIGPNDYTVKEYYEYDGSVWEKMSNIYYLTSKNYDAMGDPGWDNEFSDSDLPQNYLPKYLDNLYPTAGDGVSIIVIYKYNTGENTVTLADEYTLTAGEWISSYSYVQEMMGQFAVSAISELWVFDPTETYTMVSDDYQTIVDYVKAEYGDSYLDSYGTQEFYYGAGSYYSNFDIRGGKWNSDEFDDWEEAVSEAIGTVLLPTLYPNATVQVNGVQMYYKVVFDTYSGASGTYSMKFKVEEGPTFTYVEESTTLL